MGDSDQPSEPDLPPMRAQDFSEVQDWPGYFGPVLGKGARETLIAALESFAQEGFTGGLLVPVASGARGVAAAFDGRGGGLRGHGGPRLRSGQRELRVAVL
jgi:hypothetical protein